MKVFIIYAHQEPQSFNGSLKEIAVNHFQELNSGVMVSDLYAMNFNPVASVNDFQRLTNSNYFKYSQEQKEAAINNSLAFDILEEQEKLLSCDLLIIQFPLWWYGFPAILKGWIDRVITKGKLYDDGKIYDKGHFQGKRAFFTLTTGGTPNPTVGEDDIEKIIGYLSHGILYFLGFEVLKPFIVFSPARMTVEKRTEKLSEYKKYLEDLNKPVKLKYAKLDTLGENYCLNCSS